MPSREESSTVQHAARVYKGSMRARDYYTGIVFLRLFNRIIERPMQHVHKTSSDSSSPSSAS